MVLLAFHPPREQIRETLGRHGHPPRTVLLRNRHQHHLLPITTNGSSSESVMPTDDDGALGGTFDGSSCDGAELDGELDRALSAGVDHRAFEETWTG